MSAARGDDGDLALALEGGWHNFWGGGHVRCGFGRDSDLGMALLNNLASLYSDHLSIAEVIPNLMELLLRQQTSIDALARELENVKRAQVAIKAQENVNQIIRELSPQGTDFENVEVTIHIDTHSKLDQSSSEREGSSDDLNVDGEKGWNVELAGVASKLAALKLGTSAKASALKKHLSTYARACASQQQEDRTGIMVYKFGAVRRSAVGVPAKRRGVSKARKS